MAKLNLAWFWLGSCAENIIFHHSSQTDLRYGNWVHIPVSVALTTAAHCLTGRRDGDKVVSISLTCRTEVVLLIWIIHTLGLVQNVVTSPMWPCPLRELRCIEVKGTMSSSHARWSASFHELHKFGCIQSRRSSRKFDWILNRQRVYWKKNWGNYKGFW